MLNIIYDHLFILYSIKHEIGQVIGYIIYHPFLYQFHVGYVNFKLKCKIFIYFMCHKFFLSIFYFVILLTIQNKFFIIKLNLLLKKKN